jgi:hypothetical protein
MTRFCPNCGTEVDDTAVFCPTCGQPVDQAAEAEIPAAPGWPEPAQPAEPPPTTQEPEDQAPIDDRLATPTQEEVTRVEAQPASTPPPPEHGEPGGPALNLPVTMPLMLSGWLIGIGALLAALGVVISLFDGVLNPIELILLLALIGIAATTFFSDSLPTVPNMRLATLSVALIGFGIALDRLGFGGAGVGELLLFLGTAMAAMGAIILELGRDQPLGGPR